MRELGSEAEKIMMERFGKDTVIALATVEHGVPYVRKVNAYYEDGSFYIITYALSNKIKQIEKNPNVAIAGDWFTAHGKGNNLGYFGKEENRIIAEKLKSVFTEWIDNGHNNFDDENTIILCVELTDGVLLSHGIRYEF
ncbi:MULTISPECIES: pyridoxamine 5'-phosphate oxidase family protein [Oscillospiraceae]|uniref:pyridoxamine 5'-phosphate oxidase family protein n=1 Tax=Oscillospiraceae TaxID=216572 RepID=UPI000B3AC8E2|nr:MULTISPECIES: pyridoxamine 5'-phosphate oxidase family protein [Oscillospiraceae]OUQ45810.1 pyridoxamine 5'-phosphate oxidase [Drancourtella sp. An12]